MPGFSSAVNTITFTIKNIDSFASYSTVRSPSLTVGRFRFRIFVHPKGTASTKATRGDNELSIFIEADPPESWIPEWSVPEVKYGIKLCNQLWPEESIRKVDCHTFTKEHCDRGWHDFLSLKTLMDKSKGWLGQDNSVLIQGYAKVNISDDAWEAMLTPEAKARLSFTSDLSLLWSSGWQSDVTLRAGGQELKAHSLILASRSSVFKLMFNSGMAEASSKVIDIPDISPDVLNHFCSFLYCGTIDESIWGNCHMMSGLMFAASKYDVSSLASLCASKALESVDVENVAELLGIASKLNMEDLKARCISFAAEHLSQVQVTSGWEQLMQDKNLVFELAPLLFKTISPPAAKKARHA